MSRYRQSTFDPNAFADPGAPLRPFNWLQWTGVAVGLVGVALFVLHAAGWLGWIEPVVGQSTPGAMLTVVGAVLVNSRRGRPTDVAPELASARKRMLLIILALCAVVLGAAAAIQFTGA